MPEGMTGEARLKVFCALGFEFSHRLKDEVEKGLGNQHNKNIARYFRENLSKGLPARGWDNPFFFHSPGALPIFSLPLSA
jgi:hypothetical protein